MDFKHMFLLSTVLLHAENVDGVKAVDVNRLLTDKLVSYNTNLRPCWNQSRPLDVTISMELVSIQGIDEVEERLTIVAVFVLVWKDEFMIWDEEDYGGVSEVLVGQTQVWTPNLVLINSLENFESINKDWNIIRYYSYGYAVHYPGDIFSVSCQVDATFYPWDTQSCSLVMSAWGYGISEIQLSATFETIALSFFVENGAWDLTTSRVYAETGSPTMNFVLVLSRKPAYVIINVILPVLFMAILNILVFVIPIDSGERISYSITVLLAIAVFLTIVGDNLPKTSSPMSILSYFLVLVLGVSVLIIICTIQSIRLYQSDESKEIGGIWKCLVKCFRCRCRKRQKRTKGDNSRTKTISTTDVPVLDRHSLDNNFKGKVFSGVPYQNIVLRLNTKQYARSHPGIYTPDHAQSEHLEHVTDEDGVNLYCTWKDVSDCFDKLAIIFFIVIFVTSVTAFMLLISLNKGGQVSDGQG